MKVIVRTKAPKQEQSDKSPISTHSFAKNFTHPSTDKIWHVLLNYVILKYRFSATKFLNLNLQVGKTMNEENQNSDDNLEKLHELYVKEEEDLSKRELSNVENLDKAVLSLSSAGLGLSLVFIRNVVELAEASHLWLLHLSWLMFVLAITSTLLSYLFGQHALKKQREFIEKYYLENDEDAGKQISFASRMTYILSYVSVFTYIAAVSFTALFIMYN